MSLIAHLPPEAAYKRAERETGWTELEELVALLGTLAHTQIQVTVAAVPGVKRSQVPKPLEITPPAKRQARPAREPLTRHAIRQRMLHPGKGVNL